MRLGLRAFLAFFLDFERDRRRARRLELERRFFDRRRGARGLLAVRRRALLLERDFLAPRGVAARRLDFDLDLDRLREREVEALDRLLDVERERLAARGLEAVRDRFFEELRRVDLERLREVLAEELRLGARGAAARLRAFLARRRDLERVLEREVDRLLDVERLAARGLEAVRRRFEELRRVDLERLREVLTEELRLGARGAAARLRAFLARRREADFFLDFFGARGLDAVRRFLDRDFFAPRGAAARRRDRDLERLLDLLRLREVERLREVDREAARGFEALLRLDLDRLLLRRAFFAFLTRRLTDLLREVDTLRSRLPVSLSRALFCAASKAAFSAMYFL